MKRLLLAAAAILFVPQPRGGLLAREPFVAGVRVYYGPSDGFESLDDRLIAGAKKRIDMAAYVLTDRGIISALGAAAMRGVRVRLYLDGEERGRAAAALEAIAGAPNVEVRRKGRSRDLMHLKSFQVDGRVLRTGSANFSVSGGEFQDNDLILIESREAVAQFEDVFERLWTRSDNQKIGSR
jgi:phosphatidylserine/phosphatidylglycerophosphate/cardiolipin synthase-like enzyme